ncbi:MAG: glycosyl hydrolase, partial [Halieaceae bacterium]
FIASIPATVLLRIGYEFDGAWNEGYENKARFVEVFRRIAGRLKEMGLNNVEFVWQGSAASVDIILDEGRSDNMQDWYPGDDVVDWVGLSWFMQPNEQPSVIYDYRVPTPLELSTNLINIAKARKKPVLIAEAAPQAFDLSANTTAYHSPIWDGPSAENIQALTSEQIWGLWYQPMFDLIAAHPETIRGLAYINVRWQDQAMWGPPYSSGYWGDSRLEANTVIAKRFNEALADWKTKKGSQ